MQNMDKVIKFSYKIKVKFSKNSSKIRENRVWTTVIYKTRENRDFLKRR